jgi:hypothetical protein
MANANVTFKIYRVKVSDLLKDSVADLQELFTFHNELSKLSELSDHDERGEHYDPKLQNIVKNENDLGSDTLSRAIQKYSDIYRDPIALIDYFEDIYESDTSLHKIRNLMKIINKDLRNMADRKAGSNTIYAMGPVHFMICCLIKNCNPVVSTDMIDHLLDIMIDQDNSAKKNNITRDIGGYCMIQDLSNIKTLVNSDQPICQTDLKFVRDSSEDIDRWEHQLIRIDKARTGAINTGRMTASLKIKFDSLEEIVRDLIKTGESVVAQYVSEKKDKYSHRVKGPLISTLISVVESTGFDVDKETDLKCFPIYYGNERRSIIEMSFENGSAKARPFALPPDTITGSDSRVLKRLMNLFAIIEAHARPIFEKDKLISSNLCESDIVEFLRLSVSIESSKTDFLLDDTLEHAQDLLEVGGYDHHSITTRNNIDSHFLNRCTNPYTPYLERDMKEFNSNPSESRIYYTLDTVSWLSHIRKIDRALKKIEIDSKIYSYLLRIAPSSRLDIMDHAICTLHPGIVFNMMKGIIESRKSNEFSDSYIALTAYVLGRLIVYVDRDSSGSTKILSDIMNGREISLGLPNDLICIRDGLMSPCINCTKTLKRSKTDHLSFGNDTLIISSALYRVFTLRLLKLVCRERNLKIESALSLVTEVMMSDLMDAMLNFFDEILNASSSSSSVADSEIGSDSKSEYGDDQIQILSDGSDSSNSSNSSVDSDASMILIDLDPPDRDEIEGLGKIKLIETRLSLLARAVRLASFDMVDNDIMRHLDGVTVLRSLCDEIDGSGKTKRFDILNDVMRELSQLEYIDCEIRHVLSNIEYRKCRLYLKQDSDLKDRMTKPITIDTLNHLIECVLLVEVTSKRLNKTGHFDREIRTRLLNLMTTNIDLVRFLDRDGELAELIFRTYNPDVIIGYLNRTVDSNRIIESYIARLCRFIESNEREYYAPEDLNELVRILRVICSSYGSMIVMADDKTIREKNKIYIDSHTYRFLNEIRKPLPVSGTRFDDRK